MNRKQWFVLGIGLIITGLIFDFIKYFHLYEMYMMLATIGIISFTLGILFIICGFLEPKKKK